MNVDLGELAKFAAAADQWWQPTGEFKTLHQINPLRFQFINENSPIAGCKVVDIGCGGGILTEALATIADHVMGIDLEPLSIGAARAHSAQQKLNIDYQLCSVEALATTHTEQFDIVTCLEMLEHVPNPQSVIQACAALCKPGGSVYFSTLNRNPKAYALAILGAEYVLRWLKPGTHDYAKFIKPAELAAMANPSLQLVANRGISYSILQRAFILSDDVSVNYLQCYKK